MKKVLSLCFVFIFALGFTQEPGELIDAYEDYTDLSREQVYVHLNKSTYISGEMLGFNAYVFHKDIKELSENTANLYCQILDKNDKVIAEKLLMMNLGVTRGEFMIDSTYTSGEYKFKSYTNWSRNFPDEHNYYLENFQVINPSDKTTDKPVAAAQDIDVQVLPESGHFLSGTENTVGVIAKNSLGLGISNLEVSILDKSRNKITSTVLNRFGIGKLLLTPDPNEEYTIEYVYNDTKANIKLPKPKDIGVLLSIQEVPGKNAITLSLKTNDASFDTVGNKNYTLVIHNGSEASEAAISFNGNTKFTTTITHNNLYTGVNMFTLFDETYNPIAERLYFNYNDLPLKTVNNATFNEIANDSIEIKLSVSNVNVEQLQNLSISVLPNESKSYRHHHNIISAVYLQPYLKSTVEQASYYFTDISQEKKYELDNLMLTQGWSSYDWTTIFNAPPEPVYDFEVGINYTINANNSKGKSLLIYPNINTSSEVLTLSAEEKSFEKRGFFPLDDEQIRIGEIRRNGGVGASNVVLQFSPSKILGFNTNYQPKSIVEANTYAATDVETFKDVEELDEVKLYAKKKYTRIEKLQNKTLGQITEFGERERQFYRTFAQFISERGFYVEETPDEDPLTGGYSIFRIFNRNIASINATSVPLIYLDNVILVDLNILNNFSMQNVDYVVINKGGAGEGIRGGAGVIRIVTDPNKQFEVTPKISFTTYDIPLTYTTPQRFYIPKYNSYDSKFFNAYGVIDWIANAKLDANGILKIKAYNNHAPVKLFIEGVVNNRELISQQIDLGN
ncbi:hypothetical protein [uncultured Psychroserpens sp.]|uniref:hypothetical protein n=1 Tax=uncultured Psychroserpens sp. TaxID=255436 RepID=UPI00262363E2|nr:hypothetical protein [uncultured Psychroserpens sp.]